MTPKEIQNLQNLLDISHSYVKVNVIRLSKKLTWKELTEITGLDSTRLQRICHGELGSMSARFLIRACNGLYEYLESNSINRKQENLACLSKVRLIVPR